MIGAWRSWARWAFDAVDPAPMAALRIAVGLLTLGWTIAFLPDVDAFLSDDGLTPTAQSYADTIPHTFPLHHPYVVLFALIVASVLVTVGAFTRVSIIVMLALLIWVQRRAPLTLNSGDVLLRNLAFYVALMPAGEIWSVDAWRRRRPPSFRAPWGLRMLQVQISILYAAAVMAKLRGDAWNNGTAVGISLQLGDLQRFVVPDAITHSLLLSSLMTYGTLVAEVFLVFGLWFPRTRWAAVVAGLAIHLGIDATLAVGWFSYALLACYLAFAPPQRVRSVWARLDRRKPAAAPPPPEPVSLVKPGL